MKVKYAIYATLKYTERSNVIGSYLRPYLQAILALK